MYKVANNFFLWLQKMGEVPSSQSFMCWQYTPIHYHPSFQFHLFCVPISNADDTCYARINHVLNHAMVSELLKCLICRVVMSNKQRNEAVAAPFGQKVNCKQCSQQPLMLNHVGALPDRFLTIPTRQHRWKTNSETIWYIFSITSSVCHDRTPRQLVAGCPNHPIPAIHQPLLVVLLLAYRKWVSACVAHHHI